MPRVRKTRRQSWPVEEMAKAIEEVLAGRMGYMKAAKTFNVPQSTLEDRIKKARTQNLSPADAAIKKLGRYTSVFSSSEERELVQYVLKLEERLFGVTLRDLRALAFELAEKNDMNHPFNKEKKMAGKTWLYAFLKRNNSLSLRRPEATSLARAKGFNKTAVGAFFNLLQSVYEEHKFKPENIYNVDETGMMTVPNKQSKILALRGKKQVGSLSSAERGTLVTVETCMNAVGNYMPVMFVFPRKRVNDALMIGAPPGSTAEYHESGWIQKASFVKWFKKFVTFANPSATNPVLLLLDGHASHTTNLELIKLARTHHVTLLCFPPHCTHRLQPLDVSLMAPLSTYYEQETKKWLIQNPGRAISIYQVAQLFGAAFSRAATMQTAQSGFSKTGIWPFNPDVFPDYLFAPSETTERSLPAPSVSAVNSGQDSGIDVVSPGPARIANPTASAPVIPESASIATVEESPGTSTPKSGPSTSSTKLRVSPFDVRPIPKAGNDRIQKISKARGKTAVLTTSPYKRDLEKEEEKKKGTTKRKSGAKTARILKKKTVNSTHDSSSSEEEEEEHACIFCNELFSDSKDKEGWIQCVNCKGWAHEACTGLEDIDDIFICDFCQ
ncbi:hypothetical protein PPYR_07756 [Photinus pyralis]|nr:tigger transposable element-derived protein 2-like [Photinus pyralis]KAB0799876.1 hypothetical protein PPYR_07756 [Photinus pyralis]